MKSSESIDSRITQFVSINSFETIDVINMLHALQVLYELLRAALLCNTCCFDLLDDKGEINMRNCLKYRKINQIKLLIIADGSVLAQFLHI